MTVDLAEAKVIVPVAETVVCRSGAEVFAPGFGQQLGGLFRAARVAPHQGQLWKDQVTVLDTLILCPEGGGTLDAAGESFVLSPMDGLFLSAGTRIGWRPPRPFLMITRSSGAADGKKVVHLAAAEVLSLPSQARAASDFIGQVPVQTKSETIDVGTGSAIGMWESTPYARPASIFPRAEFMFLQKGSLVSGANAYRAGELFYVPVGANVGFEAPDPVRKIYWNQT